MKDNNISKALRFYFITDHQIEVPMLDQVRSAVSGGATMVQYRNKEFTPDAIDEVYEIAYFCKLNNIPLIINDDILLARAVDANGVHLGQDDASIETAVKVLGKDKIFGISVSNLKDFERTDLSLFDYIGIGPVFKTNTKPDAKTESGPVLIKKISGRTSLPIVGIGGIDKANAKEVLEAGACGISVISAVSRSKSIEKTAIDFSRILNTHPKKIKTKWKNEFQLIEKLKKYDSFHKKLKVEAGDDSALLHELKRPVISTDTQREDVHFKRQWQTYYEIGYKAVSVSLSDLAASYARPESIFINLGLPSYVSDHDIEEIYKGIDTNLSNFGTSIGGGNITKAEKISIDLFVVGEGEGIFPCRSAAISGQYLCSTGSLGLAKAGLEILMNKTRGYDFLVESFKFPKPRFDAAEILKSFKVKCVTDISDGLSGDMAHIAKESGLTAAIIPDEFEINQHLLEYCRNFRKDPMEYIISGGEDYELLFACSKEIFLKVKEKIPEVFVAGRLIEFTGDFVKGNLCQSSFNHGSL